MQLFFLLLAVVLGLCEGGSAGSAPANPTYNNKNATTFIGVGVAIIAVFVLGSLFLRYSQAQSKALAAATKQTINPVHR
jgi:mannitol-specific phosphotransferase system IIBC component